MYKRGAKFTNMRGGGVHQEKICYNGILMNELANKAAGSLSSERKPTKLVLLFLTITRFSPSSMVYGGNIFFFSDALQKGQTLHENTSVWRYSVRGIVDNICRVS